MAGTRFAQTRKTKRTSKTCFFNGIASSRQAGGQIHGWQAHGWLRPEEREKPRKLVFQMVLQVQGRQEGNIHAWQAHGLPRQVKQEKPRKFNF